MRERGFTLVEIAIVVVIAGILVAFAMPAFSHYRDSMARKQCRNQLIEDVRMARQMAVTQHTQVVLAFGNGVSVNDITSYTIHADNNGDRQVQASEMRWNRKVPNNTRLTTVSLSPTDSLIFDISGILWPGTTGGQLIYTSKRGALDTLNVSATGIIYHS